MEKFNFNHKAKTSAIALYDLLTKYGPKILRKEESRETNRAICDIYLYIYLDEVEEFVSRLKRLNAISSMGKVALSENIVFFTDHSSDSPLKTLNSAIIEILQGGRINQESIDFILDKMKQKASLAKLRSKTFISLGDGVKEQYVRESKGCPVNVIEIDKRRLNIWVSDVLDKGIEEVSKDDSWGDHKLTRSNELKGKRSVRLSFAGRIIYRVDQEILDGTLINKVTILRITSTHDYSDKES
jgi:hypothetical protein